MFNAHISSQFDADLSRVANKLSEMGALVEAQVERALVALACFDPAVVDHVIAEEKRLNVMEVAMDAEISNIIARRQPTARDLRLLMAISKIVTNLERAGDEARKIAKRSRRIAREYGAQNVDISELKASGAMASDILKRALKAFTELDRTAADAIIRDDEAIDLEFRRFVEKLAGHMMEEPRSIAACLDYITIAKAIERIGDHATNMAEYVVYVLDGTDMRHQNPAVGLSAAAGAANGTANGTNARTAH